MAIYLATKTMALIDQCIEQDQGGLFRQWQRITLAKLEDAYRGQDDGYRAHLGASLIGRKCARQLWYTFRWAKQAKFQSRQLRLFNRGHLEEGRFVAMLSMIGVTVYELDQNGKQYRVSWANGHCGGSGDGIAVGLPELPAGVPCVCEFKTHNDTSFKKLIKLGVKEAKPEHYVQMQTYMRNFGISYALYMAANKNDDSIHAEYITIDNETATSYMDRAEQIIWMSAPPERIAKSAGWFDCKWCDVKDICHNGEWPSQNCRTCEFSLPINNVEAGWACRRPMLAEWELLTKEKQVTGCEFYCRKEDF